MGLDIWLESKACPTCDHIKTSKDLNYTYNVGEMWREIYPGEQMVSIDGMTGKDSWRKLKDALIHLEAYPAKFILMNPENGWGSYETFKDFIRELIVLAQEFPDYIWKTCR